MLNGIDTSHHQSFSDYQALNKSNHSFVFIKATEKVRSDPMFATHSHEFAKTKLLRGAYHFLRFSADGKSQAQAFINTVQHVSPPMDLPPVLDIEDTSETLTQVQCEAIITEWLTIVEAAFGVPPIIYTGGWYWRDKTRLNDSIKFKGYPLWTSRYPKDVAMGYLPMYGGWEKPTFWQYTEKGTVVGLDPKTPIIDLNFFIGDIDALWKILKSPPNKFSELSNEKIQAVQSILKLKGFYNGAVDGLFASTDPALKAWQSANGLPQSNSVDAQQWQALFDLLPTGSVTQVVAGPVRPGTFQTPEKGFVISDKLNIRAGAGSGNPLVASPLSKGQSLNILEESNGWYRVNTQIEGWVKKELVRAQ